MGPAVRYRCVVNCILDPWLSYALGELYLQYFRFIWPSRLSYRYMQQGTVRGVGPGNQSASTAGQEASIDADSAASADSC